MALLAAAWAYVASGNAAAELRQLDALYARFDPYPIDSPRSSWGLLDGYKDFIDDYGPIPRAEAGLGKCFFFLGRYREAASAFRLAGKAYRGRYKEATFEAHLAEEVGREDPACSVRQLVHIPGKNRWVALLTSKQDASEWPESGFAQKLVQFKVAPGAEWITSLGKPQMLGDFWAGDFSTLYLTKLSRDDRTPRLMLFRQGIGDCEPVDIRFYTPSSRGLKAFRYLNALEGSWVRGPSADHGLLVLVGALWHVSWFDVYEWTGKTFALANRRFPQYVPIEKRKGNTFKDWMILAAQLDTHGRFRQGQTAWRNALHECHAAIARENSVDDQPSHVSSTFDSSENAAKEIRRRLRWLAHKDYNQPQLYRPLDRGLGAHENNN